MPTSSKFVYFLLFRYPQSSRSNDLDQSSHLLTVATRDLFNELDKNVKPVAPMQFWMVHFPLTSIAGLCNYTFGVKSCFTKIVINTPR